MRWFGSAEGRDGHDAIEEIAKLDWCNGKVGMAGNSWLAVAQYYVAAEKPAHLACIAPLEGFSDPAREMALRGGIPHTSFSKTIANTLTGTCSVKAIFHPSVDCSRDAKTRGLNCNGQGLQQLQRLLRGQADRLQQDRYTCVHWR